MGKKKQKDWWTRMAETADELNQKLGLDPAISTEEVSEADLERDLSKAATLVDPSDELSEQAQTVVDRFLNDDLPERAEEPEEEPEMEEAEEAEEYTLEDMKEFVNEAGSKEELLEFAEDFPDLFSNVIEKQDALGSTGKVAEAMLYQIDKQIKKESGKSKKAKKPAEKKAKKSDDKKSEEKASKKKAKKKAKKSGKKKSDNKPAKKKGRGVIATIASAIEDAGEEGISKEDILELLVEEFPNRDADSMSNTINVQVPTRISKERFNVERTEEGTYRKAEEE